MPIEEAQSLFRSHNPYPGEALENHNKRIIRLSLALATHRMIAVDEGILTAGAYLHDLGLLVTVEGEPLYLRRSWFFVKPLLKGWGVQGERLGWLRDILLYNHSLLPIAGLSAHGDLVRRAVQIEHSRGIRKHGLPLKVIKRTFADHPRLDLNRILLDFARITLLRDGARQLLPIFLPGPLDPEGQGP